jgi:hypothetical protein
MALKPCPFCNAPATQRIVDSKYVTGCMECEIIHIGVTPEYGANLWNRRHKDYQTKFLGQRNTMLKKHIEYLYKSISLIATEISKETSDE